MDRNGSRDGGAGEVEPEVNIARDDALQRVLKAAYS